MNKRKDEKGECPNGGYGKNGSRWEFGRRVNKLEGDMRREEGRERGLVTID